MLVKKGAEILLNERSFHEKFVGRIGAAGGSVASRLGMMSIEEQIDTVFARGRVCADFHVVIL